ncbi:DUF2651 family protein [Romboutsia sp. MSSM.1001216sp_RTP31141st1_G3_RTP31141_220114]|uniref:DUF2651 family protein n=1 Tax=unclassified Romboutsia TaxID=2626894 RepID=UPI0031B5D041
MDIIKFINENTDPFIMQLVIVPFISIGLGVLVSIKTKKVFLAPLITFILSFIYTKFFVGIPLDHNFKFGWEIIFSISSLIISLIIRGLTNKS